ncbi:O-antigen ligase family protein [Microvirga aerophila]|uniref:O-antigen ligase family protein n=1 Tax=Microvirga aerophila TaxID=670291 RepID=UPI0014784B30|nr:O-antigen ligase family protein [Microvirga aerophila]
MFSDERPAHEHSKALASSLFILIAAEIPIADSGSGGIVAPVMRLFGIIVGVLIVFRAIWIAQIAQPHRWLIILWPIAPLLVYCYTSTLWSLDPAATLSRSLETTALAIFTAFWALLAASYTTNSRQIARIIAIAIICVVIYGMSVNIALSGVPLRLTVNREESLRLRLVFGFLHPLAVGDILAIGLIGLCASDLAKILILILCIGLFWLLILTDATGARFLVLVICPTLLVLHTRYKRQWAHRGAIALLLLIFGVTLAILFDVKALGQFNDQRLWTLTGRTSLWRQIIDSGLAETWFGTGYDGARPAIQQVFGTAYQVHNFYLAIPVELGYVGVPLFLIFFIPWFVRVVGYPNPITLSFGAYIVVIGINNSGTFSKGHLAFALMLPYCMATIAPLVSSHLSARDKDELEHSHPAN